MSREQLEALGYTFVESDLPPIVREWSVGDAVLCATLSDFDYSDNEAWKKLKPYPIERVLAGYWIFGGLGSPVSVAHHNGPAISSHQFSRAQL